jgi:hypothetical protein
VEQDGPRLRWRHAGAVWATNPAEHPGPTWNLDSDLAKRFRLTVRFSMQLSVEQVTEA